MRAFVAVVPPAAAVAALRDAVDPLRDHENLGWVGPERWHVTLAFLGEVGDGQLARLMPRLADVAARHRRARLAIRGGGCFPNARRPRVFWAGVDGDVGALAALAGDVARAARASRIPVDPTRFRPHVTLARVRGVGFPAAEAVLRGLEAVSGPPWTAGRVVLFRSRLGPAPRYEELASWPLSGDGASPAARPG